MLTNGAENCKPLVDRILDRNREGLVHALIKLARLAKNLVSIKQWWWGLYIYSALFISIKEEVGSKAIFFKCL